MTLFCCGWQLYLYKYMSTPLLCYTVECRHVMILPLPSVCVCVCVCALWHVGSKWDRARRLVELCGEAQRIPGT